MRSVFSNYGHQETVGDAIMGLFPTGFNIDAYKDLVNSVHTIGSKKKDKKKSAGKKKSVGDQIVKSDGTRKGSILTKATRH